MVANGGAAKQAAANLLGSDGQQQQLQVLEAAALGRYCPDGYELPQECEKHASLFSGIFEDLRPWLERGITRADLDACAEVAPAGYNLSVG